MRAMVRDRYGAADTLRMAQIARPTIADHEVLLSVHAAGLDRGAWHLMTGEPHLLRLAFGLRRPRNPVLGREVAGTVQAVGAGVSQFRVGDEVFGIGEGCFAEYAVARADKLARKPVNATFEQSAAVAISALTALQALSDAGRVESGQTVLVTGASGGVGTYAVQLAKAFGAEVTGVCSTGKLDLVRSVGADHVIDYTHEDFADGQHRYDLVLDIAGNPTLSRLRRALTPHGTAVLVGGEEGGSFSGGMNRQLRATALSLFVKQRLSMMLCKERGADLELLADLITSGKLTPTIGATYPLDELPEAMRHLESGKACGKLVISVRSAP
jgi:NADPH:quinone reductase-like Zn-dependent oxidoreductase